MILERASSLGWGNSIFLSRRPDLRRAGSRMSTRLVAAITWGGGIRIFKLKNIKFTCRRKIMIFKLRIFMKKKSHVHLWEGNHDWKLTIFMGKKNPKFTCRSKIRIKNEQFSRKKPEVIQKKSQGIQINVFLWEQNQNFHTKNYHRYRMYKENQYFQMKNSKLQVYLWGHNHDRQTKNFHGKKISSLPVGGKSIFSN